MAAWLGWALLLVGCAQEAHLESLPITSDFFKIIENVTKYNRFATPTQYLNRSTEVALSMYIEGLSAFSPRTMDFQMDVYFQQRWTDTRLKHNYPKRLLLRDRTVFEQLWHPDLYFANAKESSFQDVTMPNFLTWIYQNGTIFYDARISLTVICMMDLSKYPLDSQKCELRIMSYAYDETQLKIAWSLVVDPVSYNPDIRMPDMHVVAISTGTCDGEYATGTWSCVRIIIHVRRELMHHVMQTYLPSALIVVISWFSFWLDVDAAPARVSLSITTLLTVSTQANTVKMSLPEVSYMKAIDVWMGVCMTFVFGVMIEFTVCHWARNRRESKPTGKPNGARVSANNRRRLFDRNKAPDEPGVVSPFIQNNHSPLPDGEVQIENEADEDVLFEVGSTAAADAAEMELLGLQVAADSPSRTPSTPTVVQLRQLQDTQPVVTLMHNNKRARSANSTLIYRNRCAAAPSDPLAAAAGSGGSGNNNNNNNNNGAAAPDSLSRTFVRGATARTQKLVGTLRSLQGRRVAQGIDMKCRWLFPLSFLIFNLVYWIYYLYFAPDGYEMDTYFDEKVKTDPTGAT